MAFLILAPFLLQGCVTTNPATGGSDYTPFMSPAKEARIGKEQNPLVIAEHGGVVADPKIGGYVAVIGGRLATVSELPNSPFTFTVLNSPIVNAFALPGGYIYVTRGILALFNSESEMASVLGHEIGHVTARHSAKKYNQQIFAGLGAALIGTVFKSKELGDIAGYGSQLYVQSYSRDNEYEADQLSIRYTTRAGFDPYGAADMLRALDAQTNLQDVIANRTGQSRPPEFFSTHPNTQDRVSRAFNAAQKTGVPQNSRNPNHNLYLNIIDGMIYGDDPDHGVINGQNFSHGPLRVSFDVPDNYRLINDRDAVYAQGYGPAEGGMIIFSGGTLKGRNMTEFTTQTWGIFVKEHSLQGLENITINGMQAITGYTIITVNKIPSEVRIVAIHHHDNQAYYFLIITPIDKLKNMQDDLQRMTYSFKKLSDKAAKAIKGRIIRVVSVKAGDTPSKLSQRMAFPSHKLDQFLVLNGLGANTILKVGQRVKLVINEK